jgi:uncharacterized protein YutE (UPF0331/DUF86 family)
MISENYLRRLEGLRKYVAKLKKLRQAVDPEILRNPESVERDSVERNMQLSIQSVLDLGSMIIADYSLGTPNDNEHIIAILGNNEVLKPELAERIKKMGGMRNALVHDYLYVDEDELFDAFENRLGDFDDFARQIAGYLEGNGS